MSVVSNGSGNHAGKKPRAKTLLCFTHLSTGACIYGDHCCFIHDHRLNGDVLPSTSLEQRNAVDHKIREDPLYWPPTFYSQKQDEYWLDPKIIYHDDLRYKSVSSIWHHFLSTMHNDPQLMDDSANFPKNSLTNRQRLPVFRALAETPAGPPKHLRLAQRQHAVHKHLAPRMKSTSSIEPDLYLPFSHRQQPLTPTTMRCA